MSAGDIAMANALAEQKFFKETNKGDKFVILFDRGRKNEALYSGEIISFGYGGRGLEVYVEYHHDGDRRKYYWKKFVSLTIECNKFMNENGITQFDGIIRTRKR